MLFDLTNWFALKTVISKNPATIFDVEIRTGNCSVMFSAGWVYLNVILIVPFMLELNSRVVFCILFNVNRKPAGVEFVALSVMFISSLMKLPIAIEYLCVEPFPNI